MTQRRYAGELHPPAKRYVRSLIPGLSPDADAVRQRPGERPNCLSEVPSPVRYRAGTAACSSVQGVMMVGLIGQSFTELGFTVRVWGSVIRPVIKFHW